MAKLQKGINDLQTWCLENGEFGQQLLQEWTGQCITDGKHYNPDEVAKASNKKFRWQCSKDPSHIWDVKIVDRTSYKTSCPYCAERVSIENSLLTWCQSNGEYGQQLLQEWTGLCIDDNKTYTTDEVTKATPKKFRWKCSKNPSHIWDATLNNRTNGSGCPHCYKESKSEIVSFSMLKCSVNDLQTWCNSKGSYGQQHLQEWTGLCIDDNKQYTLDIVTKASHKKFKWKCSKDPSHVWDATVASRTYGSGCPYCNKCGTSYPEQVIYRSLKQVFPNTISRDKFQGYEFDISIPEIKTRIEYSGINWHKDKLDRDDKKAQLCENHNVKFIQIYAHRGEIKSEDIYEPNFILYKVDTNNHNNQLKNIISQILTQFNHSIDEVDFNKACEEAFEYEGSVQDGVNDLKTWCTSNGSYGQQLLNEWTGQCITNGKYYNPEEVTRGTAKKFRWQCSKDPSHIWDARVNDRTQGNGCPYCAGRKTQEHASLQAWCKSNGSYGQQLLQEWTGLCLDDNKQYAPEEVTKATHKKFRWKCSKDQSHIWDTQVAHRTNGSGCPYCNRVSEENSLLTWCQNNGSFGQQLLQEWTGLCSDDNKQYTLDEAAKASNKKFRWKCSKNPSHIWDASLNQRTSSKTSCPHCRKPKS